MPPAAFLCRRLAPRLLFWVLALGSPGLRAQDLPLETALRLALEHNRGLANSALDAAKARDRLEAARTRQFPSFSLFALGAQQLNRINFTFERGLLGTFPAIGPVPEQDVRVSTPLRPTGFLVGRVSQPLSSLHRLRLNIGLLRLGAELAREQTRADRQEVVRNVKRAYYGLQQVEASLQAVRESLKLYRELDALTARYVQQEVALRSELLDVQTRQARAEQTELTLLHQQASGKEQLNLLLGRDVLTEFAVASVAEAGEYEADLAAARRQAFERRPELRQARLRRQQAEQDLRVKKAESIPDVAAEFNNITLLNFSRFLPLQTSSVGLSVTWEPFDWGRRKQEAAEKRHALEQQDHTLADTEAQVLIDVNDKHRQLAQARAQLRVARLAQQTGLESLRVVQNRYRVESVLLKDVLQAQVSLEQANSDYQQALAAFWNARADFERALGEEQ